MCINVYNKVKTKVWKYHRSKSKKYRQYSGQNKKDILGPLYCLSFFYLWLPITSTPPVSSNISINNVSNITHLRYKNNRISRYVILEMKMWEKSETVLYTLEHSFLSRIHTEISSLQNSFGFETNHVCGVIVNVFVSNVIDRGPNRVKPKTMKFVLAPSPPIQE